MLRAYFNQATESSERGAIESRPKIVQENVLSRQSDILVDIWLVFCRILSVIVELRCFVTGHVWEKGGGVDWKAIFFFRWFRFSLRTWAIAALTWAKGVSMLEQSLSSTWAEPEYPEHTLSTPRVSLRTIIWSPFSHPVYPGYNFLEFLPGNPFLLPRKVSVEIIITCLHVTYICT